MSNMSTGVNTCITWSVLELRGLLENEDARVSFERASRHHAIHPFHLNDLNRALREILDANVNSYVDELRGLVLAYKNPKLLSPLGAILHDSYFIHIDVQADFYIFKPEIGCVLKGIANKKAASHIGVLVHKAFNVSIPKPEDCDEWLGDYVFIGQEVKFTVTHLDFKGKLPFIRGVLMSDGISHSTYHNEDSVVASDREDNKEAVAHDAVTQDGVESATKKKRPKKSSLIDSSGDEISDADDKRKVFRKQEAANRSEEKLRAKLAIYTRQLNDSSAEELSADERREVNPVEAQKQRRISSESSESEDGPRRKAITKSSSETLSKENGNPDTSTERAEPVDREPTVQSVKVEKLAKKKPPKEAESLDTSIEPEVSADKNPKVNSLKVEKAARRRRSKADKDSLDTSVEPENAVDREPTVDAVKAEKSAKKKSPKTNGVAESEELIDEKPRINKPLNVEKSAKKKTHKKLEEIASNPSDDSEQVDTKFAVGRITMQVDETEDVISPKKGAKKNRAIESDNEDTTGIEIKSETPAKKKTKRKKHNEADKSDLDEEVAANSSHNSSAFEFIKPEVKPEHKRKRRKNIVQNDESGDCSRTNLTENLKEPSSDFFRDIRIKVEPPSDVEDAAATEKRTKRKRRHSAAVKEEGGTSNAAEDEISYPNVGIKVEPDASDVEDAKPRKKKSKKRQSDENSFANVAIKAEPNASDAEETKPRRKFKSEPEDRKVKVNDSPRKGEVA